MKSSMSGVLMSATAHSPEAPTAVECASRCYASESSFATALLVDVRELAEGHRAYHVAGLDGGFQIVLTEHARPDGGVV